MSVLTKFDKSRMIQSMLDYHFAEKLGEATRLLQVEAASRIKTDTVRSLPPSMIKDGWIKTQNSFVARIRTTKKVNNWNDESRHMDLLEEVPIKASMYIHEVDVPLYDREDTLTKTWLLLRSLEEERSEMRRTLESVLASCNTAKKLVELIPEAADFLPDKEKAQRSLVPQEQVDSIRAMLRKGVA